MSKKHLVIVGVQGFCLGIVFVISVQRPGEKRRILSHGNYSVESSRCDLSCASQSALISSSTLPPVSGALTAPTDPPVSGSLAAGTDLEILRELFPNNSTLKYYDKKYWTWQKGLGSKGGILEQWKFQSVLDSTEKLQNCIDFGAGGGFLLQNLKKCGGKIGVEINPHAREEAWNLRNIKLVASCSELPDSWADVIVSNHALEHVFCPWCELKKLKHKLKVGGKIVMVVPAAGKTHEFSMDDIHNHLYSWSPGTLGNLMKAAGYVKLQCEALSHQWPRNAMQVLKSGLDRFIQEGQAENARNPFPSAMFQVRCIGERGET